MQPKKRSALRSGFWKLSLLALMCVCLLGADVKRGNEPRFTSFADKYPTARPHYPGPPPPWGRPAVDQYGDPVQISGFDVLLTFTGRPSNKHVLLQRVVTTGFMNICGKLPIPVRALRFEYFAAEPAYDVRAFFAKPAEMFIDKIDSSEAAYVVLPGKPPAIPPGQASADLGAKYFRSLSKAQSTQLQNDCDDNTLFLLLVKYEYDGCNPPPATPATSCQKMHCLTIKKKTRPDSTKPFGRWSAEPFFSKK